MSEHATRQALEMAGLEPLSWYGGWELVPFTLRSDQLIVVAHCASLGRPYS